MSEPIRWGILGTGFAARNFAEGLRSAPGAKLIAIGSRELSRAKQLADQHGGRATGSYEELIRAADIDVVYIATTADRHSADCLLCLSAGKPVLCEKPFALNAVEAREIVAAAREKRLFCMEAMWMRFQPLVLKTRELVQSGAIGEVRMLTADFGVPTEDKPESWYFNPSRGGGALLDRGAYCLSLAYFLLGEPESVAGQATIGSGGGDEQSSVLLRYARGQQALLSSSLTSYTSNQAVIAGTTGRIVIHEPFYRPHRISVSKNPPVARSNSSAGRGLKHKLVSAVRQSNSKIVRHAFYRARDWLSPLSKRSRDIIVPPLGNGYNYEAAEVMRCLRSGALESTVMPLDETVRIMETMDMIRATSLSQHRAEKGTGTFCSEDSAK